MTRALAPDRRPIGRADNDLDADAPQAVRLPRPHRPAPASTAKRLTAEAAHG